MNVTVFGASGPLGRQIVSQLLGAGHAVTAFVRDPARLAGTGDRLRPVRGDVHDPDAVRRAVARQDAVVSALGQSTRGAEIHPGAAHILGAMRQAGVTRLIWISSHGVGDSRGRSGVLFDRLIAPLALRAEFADKERQEAMITASDLDWTIVRPARLTNRPLTGRYTAEPRMRLAAYRSVGRADVAHFVVGELVRGAYRHRAPTVAN